MKKASLIGNAEVEGMKKQFEHSSKSIYITSPSREIKESGVEVSGSLVEQN
ncbi:hypothetical protein KIN20_032929 [Parelaphostrongylus tenuis]|uniref:Uncharacterized protein n=1 Tax=Parelaphostrongylus tenuis TaxID=148309 RepID=A0AAD5R7U5_PARTN|nr:hypothetical protein KIN20_032929 [Parelaphostrongylus tenuis]